MRFPRKIFLCFSAFTHQQSLWSSCQTSFYNFFFVPSVFRASINFKPTSLGQIWSEIFIYKFQFENWIQKVNNQNVHAYQDQGRGRFYTRMRQLLVYPSSHYIPTSLNKYFLLRNWPPWYLPSTNNGCTSQPCIWTRMCSRPWTSGAVLLFRNSFTWSWWPRCFFPLQVDNISYFNSYAFIFFRLI